MPPGRCPGHERPLPATLPSARRVKTSGLYPEQTPSSEPNPHYSDTKKTARKDRDSPGGGAGGTGGTGGDGGRGSE